jgi:hypothetical protein
MEQTLEDSVKQYTESLQYRIREVLTGVDKAGLDKVILDRLSHQELLSYTDKVVSTALANCLKEMTQEVQKLMKNSLKDIISEDMIRKTLQEADVAEMMTKALCKRVAASIEDSYY